MEVGKHHTLRFMLLLACGIALMLLSLSKLDMRDLAAQLGSGHYAIAFPIFIVSMLSYYFRILRWKLLYISMDERPRNSVLFASLCTGYLVSFAIPRLGELVRCIMVKRTEHVPFNKSLVSIVVERIIDLAVLLLLLLLVLVFYNSETVTFLADNILIPLKQMSVKPAYLVAAMALMILLVVLVRVVGRHAKHEKVKHFYEEWHKTVSGLRHMRSPFTFLFYTVCIWFCYFLMTWLWLFIFDESSSLGLREAFLVMVIGSIGKSLPIQGGGMGAYHFLVSRAFALFGISLLTGNALAIVIHGAQAVYTFISGSACLIWFLFHAKKGEI